MSVSYPEAINVDVDDDLNWELAFGLYSIVLPLFMFACISYKHCQASSSQCKHGPFQLAAKHNFPFTHPSDYFAEMVKSDGMYSAEING
jgi:rRNA-processing protein EBP2